MSDIFTLELTVTTSGAIKMVVPARTFTAAVAVAETEFRRWWEDYKTTSRGLSSGANRRAVPEILNVALVHRYRWATRFCHMPGALRARLPAD